MNEQAPVVSKPKEHLKPGVKPIFVCIGDSADFGDPETIEDFVPFKEDSHFIKYSSTAAELSRSGFLNGGVMTYVISTLDNLDKCSTGFYDCTGLVIAGVDKETGKNISFLSHNDPKRFLWDKSEKFKVDLEHMLEEARTRCLPGTIDAVLVGGNYLYKNNRLGEPYRKSYEGSIELITAEAKRILGFEPVIVNGPKTGKGADDLYYDNDNRRLYFIRPHLNRKIGDFVADDFKKIKGDLD